MPRKFTHRGFEMDITDDLESQLRAALDQTSLAILDLFDGEAERLGKQARDLMPVYTGKARASVRWGADLDPNGTISIVVESARKTRYIQSEQIGSFRLRDNYVKFLKGQPFKTREGKIKKGKKPPIVEDPRAKRRAAHRLVVETGKPNTKAHKLGSAMWILFRWPERHSAKEIIEPALLPLIEKELQEEVD